MAPTPRRATRFRGTVGEENHLPSHLDTQNIHRPLNRGRSMDTSERESDGTRKRLPSWCTTSAESFGEVATGPCADGHGDLEFRRRILSYLAGSSWLHRCPIRTGGSGQFVTDGEKTRLAHPIC